MMAMDMQERNEPIYMDDAPDTIDGYPVDECFVLQVTDDGMIPDMREGDKVMVHRQRDVKRGDFAIVQVDGDTMLRRVYYSESRDTVVLSTLNSRYMPIALTGEQVQEVQILGKVFRSMRSYC